MIRSPLKTATEFRDATVFVLQGRAVTARSKANAARITIRDKRSYNMIAAELETIIEMLKSVRFEEELSNG